MKVLVVSPHPDDEVLGLGGTIARLASEGNDITIAIGTKGWEFSLEYTSNVFAANPILYLCSKVPNRGKSFSCSTESKTLDLEFQKLPMYNTDLS